MGENIMRGFVRTRVCLLQMANDLYSGSYDM
jgi:hypothetical protein